MSDRTEGEPMSYTHCNGEQYGIPWTYITHRGKRTDPFCEVCFKRGVIIREEVYRQADGKLIASKERP